MKALFIACSHIIWHINNIQSTKSVTWRLGGYFNAMYIQLYVLLVTTGCHMHLITGSQAGMHGIIHTTTSVLKYWLSVHTFHVLDDTDSREKQYCTKDHRRALNKKNESYRCRVQTSTDYPVFAHCAS